MSRFYGSLCITRKANNTVLCLILSNNHSRVTNKRSVCRKPQTQFVMRQMHSVFDTAEVLT